MDTRYYLDQDYGWMGLPVVLNLADRKVVGWALGQALKAKDTTVTAFKMAIQNRPITRSLIFHSGRGIQYACQPFRNHLQG